MSKIQHILLTAILVVSFFYQSTAVYAFEKQKNNISIIQEVQKTANKVQSECIKKVGEQNRQKFLQIKEKCQKIIEEKKRQAEALKVVKYAKQFVGCPYVWGGNSLTNGCDCSHFVYNVIKDTTSYSGGYVPSRNWRALGKVVSAIDKAQPGDVIVYPGHVAIYDGKGKIIQAQNSSAGITDNREVDNANIIAIRRFV